MIESVFQAPGRFLAFLARELAPSRRRIVEAARTAVKSTLTTGLAASMQIVGPFGPLFAFRIGQPGISLGLFEGALTITCAAMMQAAIVPITGKLLDYPGLIMAFLFVGFLPPRKTARREHLESLRTFRGTLIFYEGPHRILAALEDMQEVLGDRETCIGRELTKLHEEYLFGKLSKVRDRVKELGEFVVVVGGSTGTDDAPAPLLTREAALKTLGISRNQLYDLFFKK